MRSNIYKFIAILAILMAGCLTIVSLSERNKSLKRQLEQTEATIKSYDIEYSNLNDIAIKQKRTIEELQISKDSINQKLVQAINDLKIKNKKIEDLQYVEQVASKTDSVFIRDSIFIHDFSLDTTIQDKWYRLNMTLMFPNLIVVNPQFNSELIIVSHREKEYLKERKKCFIGRLFQKKILVEKVDIKENNPYIKTTFYRNIDIIK